METVDLAKSAAESANSKKASKISVVDLRSHSSLCEYMVVCSGSNERQTKAISDSIEEEIKKKYGIRPLTVEGKQTGQWILIDYGSLVVHIFFEYVRDYYAIERLWPEAPSVALTLT